MLAFAVALAGCNASLEDIAPKTERQLPQKILATMQAKGMSRDAPIMMRIFKEEGVLEIWKQKVNGRFDLVTTYNICKWSGQLGPKYLEGDRQAPEGFYTVRAANMNPNSSYHLAFNIGFPNEYDRANGRTGAHLMVHGACSSQGCYSMTDEQMEQIWAFARDAFRGGQTEFQVQAFPFRMTAANMARYRDDPNYPFWEMLKEGYDHFEITKVPPKVDVCERRYVFNRFPVGDETFSPTGICPPTVQPETLVSAYRDHQAAYQSAFEKAIAQNAPAERRPTIAGREEAMLVAEWTRKRSRGERVPIEPPSIEHDGSIVVTSRMGRLASVVEAERRQAAARASAAPPVSGPSASAAAAYAPAAAPVTTAETPAPQESAPDTAGKPAARTADGPGRLNRLWSLFGN
jgi:murein L,D-transpeptidase YafK